MKEIKSILDFPSPKTAWDELSMPEKAEMIRVAVGHDIYSLKDIRERYNKFAEGGSTDADVVDWLLQEEGFNKKPEDIGDGKMTLGSGLTAKKWHDLYRKRGNKWSAADNRMAVTEEVANRRKWAEQNIPNWSKLPDSSQKALLSYKYNYDFNRSNSPKLFAALEKGDLQEAARQMDATSKDSKFRKGLLGRRQREQQWFLSDVPNTQTASVPTLFEQPVSTAVFNPYVQQVENTRIAPIIVPDEDSYVTAHRLTESEERKKKLQERMESIRNFNRLLELTSLDNTSTPTFMPSTGNTFLDGLVGLTKAEGGKIHIKDSKKGTFTAEASKHGKSVQEFASQVLAHKENYSPAMVKKANFARNSRKWKHGEGGHLYGDGGNVLDEEMSSLSSSTYQPLVDSIKKDNVGFNIDDYTYRVQKQHPEVTREQVANAYNFTPFIASDSRRQRNTAGMYYHADDNGYGSRIMIYPNNIKADEGVGGYTKEDRIKSNVSHETNHMLLDKVLGGNYTNEEKTYLNTAYPNEENLNEARARNMQLRKAVSDQYKGVVTKQLDNAIDKISDNDLMYHFNNLNPTMQENKINGKWDSNRTKAIREALKNVAFVPTTNTFGLPVDSNIVAYGGNLFDGTSQPAQKMQIGLDVQGWPNYTTEQIVAYGDENERRRKAIQDAYLNFVTESNDATAVANGRLQNQHLEDRAIEGAKAHRAWEEENPIMNTIGLGLGAVPFAVAAAPAIIPTGDAIASTTLGKGVTSLLANPYFDAALTSLGGAHAAQSIANGEADWMTALELTPMTRLAKPMYNALPKLSNPLKAKAIKGNLTADDYYEVPDLSTTGLPDFSVMTRAEKYKWLKTQQELAQRVDQSRTMDALRMTKDRLNNGGIERLKNAILDDAKGINPEAYDVTANSDNANAIYKFLTRSKDRILKEKPYRGSSQDVSNKVKEQLNSDIGGVGTHSKYFTKILNDYFDYRKLSGLTKGNKDAAHEFVHYMYWPITRPKGFNFFGPDADYFSGAWADVGSGEIAARGTQLKNYFGLKEGESLTPEMWLYAKRHYLKDVGDNTMSPMFNSVNTKSPVYPLFLKWINKHAPAIGTGLVTGTTLNFLDNE